MKVSKIILRLFCFLNILKILTTLNARMILVEDTPLTFKFSSKIIPITEISETVKSKKFHGSKKYLFPKPINFIIASSRNMDVKI
jgi:hypothetical protein